MHAHLWGGKKPRCGHRRPPGRQPPRQLCSSAQRWMSFHFSLDQRVSVDRRPKKWALLEGGNQGTILRLDTRNSLTPAARPLPFQYHVASNGEFTRGISRTFRTNCPRPGTVQRTKLVWTVACKVLRPHLQCYPRLPVAFGKGCPTFCAPARDSGRPPGLVCPLRFGPHEVARINTTPLFGLLPNIATPLPLFSSSLTPHLAEDAVASAVTSARLQPHLQMCSFCRRRGRKPLA